ncbi:type I-F CRISPR-associated protein Csy2 [Vibrio splendidus]|nr:type I-F CRISPR-associated protein Csy2 [Vibrio splendidus]MCC4880742.1 hypothetical protein [Vibrio splendidus]
MSLVKLIKVPMRVLDADVVTGYMAGGIPAVTAVDGMCHLIQRRFNERVDPLLEVSGWSYIIENISYHEGKYGYVGYEKDRKGKDKVISPSMRDDKKAKIDCSIILRVESELTVSQLSEKLASGELNYIFNRLRLAGGDVRVKGLRKDKWQNKLSFYDDSIESIVSCLRASGMNSMLIEDQTYLIDQFESNRIHRLDRLVDLVSKQSEKTIERAYSDESIEKHHNVLKLFKLLKDKSEDLGASVLSLVDTVLTANTVVALAQSDSDDFSDFIKVFDAKFDKETGIVSKKAQSDIQLLIEQISRAKRTFSILGFDLSDNTFEPLYYKEYLEPNEREYYGNLFALNIGYCAIGELKKRKGTRIDALHTFAEPVIGVARARTIASALCGLEEDGVNLFWSNNKMFSNSTLSDNMYIISGE